MTKTIDGMTNEEREELKKSLAVYGALLTLARIADESNSQDIDLVAAKLLMLMPDTTRNQLDKIAISELKKVLENE